MAEPARGPKVPLLYGPAALSDRPRRWLNDTQSRPEAAGHSKEDRVIEFATRQQLKLVALIEQLTEREEGQDMIEYALLAALISIVAIAIIVLIGPYLKDLFQDVVNGLATT